MDDNDSQSLLEGLQSDPANAPAEYVITEQDQLGEASGLPPAEGGEALAPGELPLEGAPDPADTADLGGSENSGSLDMPEPGESSNPEIALEQMLSVAAEDPALPSPEEAPGAAPTPTFQLHFTALSEEAKEPLKKALEAQGVSLSEKAWALGQPVLSQLTEFQAIALHQAARRLGLGVRMSASWPGAALTEDDLALGDLSGIPDPDSLLLEGAPAVALPKDEREVLLCTADALPNYPVQETKGVVSAHASLPRRLFREEELTEKLEKELRQLGRPSATMAGSQVQVVLRNLFFDLQKRALALEANSVLGIKVEAFPETSHLDPQLEQLRLVAFGTAAVVEKA